MNNLELPGVHKVGSGKVRELFDAGEHLLIVATDRISAFDVVFADPIPGKGQILTRLSEFWFRRFGQNHLITTDWSKFPPQFHAFATALSGRSMLVRKCLPVQFECVVRGYLAGSAWKEYRELGTAGGHSLPAGLQLGSRLAQPIFTPAAKASRGHDENVSWAVFEAALGETLAVNLRTRSIDLYQAASDYAAERGILIADTKFEFGHADNELLLIDECLTPDSSRFWPASEYQPGQEIPSFDKQFLRDYLLRLAWDQRPPAPRLAPSIIEQTAARYREALERLTGSYQSKASSESEKNSRHEV